MSLRAEKPANVAAPERLLAEQRAEILAGLTARPKRISPKYFYDAHGSVLFDEICLLPEYYPTRTEAAIMARRLDEIAALVGPAASVIEFGAGSNDKARRLLAALDSPKAYVPVEISGEYATEQAAELEREFPALQVRPVIADFTRPFDLPVFDDPPARNLIYFPGSTIGNFVRADAKSLLEVMRYEASDTGALLIGVDLVKNVSIVEAAYNDSRGVTAAFNLNMLTHLNAGLGGDLRPDLFHHEACYDDSFDRIEMRLVCDRSHSAMLAGRPIQFEKGEHIVTEYSHKYTVERFTALAGEAGWDSHRVWTDDDRLFSVHFMLPR